MGQLERKDPGENYVCGRPSPGEVPKDVLTGDVPGSVEKLK